MHKGRQQSEGPSTQRMLFVTISVTLPMWASTLMKVKVRLTVGGRKHYSCVGNYAEFWPMTSHRCTWHRGTNRKPSCARDELWWLMSGFKEVVGHCRYSCHVGTAIHVSRLILKTISSYLLLWLSFLVNPGPALNVLPTPPEYLPGLWVAD